MKKRRQIARWRVSIPSIFNKGFSRDKKSPGGVNVMAKLIESGNTDDAVILGECVLGGEPLNGDCVIYGSKPHFTYCIWGGLPQYKPW